MITFGRVALSVACAVALSGCAANMQSSTNTSEQNTSSVYAQSPGLVLNEHLNGFQHISLQELSSEQFKITFPGVTSFEFAARDITAEQKQALETLSNALHQIDYQALEVLGHTDNRGNYDYNLQLSRERAKVVTEYLLGLGLQSDKLGYHGKGPDEPIADNNSAAGQAQNRRIEILVYL
ncbi:OmpA family protein [Alkalimonas sp. MEB108]|uniref:OmpA family protein n=1 Tax=Alkalimonas cellulosilytica TaxID=3058395 RepID=A0ABU7J2C0_9GAMM|nr:OmpA family protein [Alkalimonas sp. MEB108]MEE2000644.1 OmpA family protein [Alkalimonas sp. MEB108]